MKKSTLQSLAVFILLMVTFPVFNYFLGHSNAVIIWIFLLVAIPWLIIELILKNKLAETFNYFGFLVLYIAVVMGFGANYGWKGTLGSLVLFPVIFFLLLYVLRFLLFLTFIIKSEKKSE